MTILKNYNRIMLEFVPKLEHVQRDKKKSISFFTDRFSTHRKALSTSASPRSIHSPPCVDLPCHLIKNVRDLEIFIYEKHV